MHTLDTISFMEVTFIKILKLNGFVTKLCYFLVKPGDANQKQLPKVPTNLDELKTSLSNLGTSAYNAILGDKKK